MINLRKITEENFIEAFNLKLGAGQDAFVSHPIRSLAQAYVYRNQCQPFGIYNDEEMVGYVMVIYDHDVPEYDIWHMMIGEQHQGKGYGKAALEKVLSYIGSKPFGDSDRVTLTCNKDNKIALTLYRSMGFRETGVAWDDELELSRGLKCPEENL
ncbi:MAG: GNAT family N-acetyltransferase [Lachnospiraceae bacterium]|nr:GNAT family N-acetyltransferase [Lachnospiraceae bacterium]